MRTKGYHHPKALLMIWKNAPPAVLLKTQPVIELRKIEDRRIHVSGVAPIVIIASDFVNDFPHPSVSVCQKVGSQWRGEYTINLVKMGPILVRDLSVWSLIPC